MASKKTLEHYLRQVRLIEEHREKWCEQNVRRHYRDLIQDLQEFLGTQYAELAENDQLTYEILHGKGEYARFLEEIDFRTSYFAGKASKTIRETVHETYKNSFNGMVEAVKKSKTYDELKSNLKGLKAATPDVIKNAVSNTFLEDALEKNHKTVIYDIKQQLGVGLAHGDRMSTMARRISEQLDKDSKKATQIVRTECHRVREAGFQDSSERISQTLKDTKSDYVMTKTWKTMQDMSVRPYRKKGKTFIKGTGPDHTKMEGVTILVEEMFDLGDGVTAKSPGQSGVAGHDINCRCYLSRDMMTKAEYEQLTGKKIVDPEPEDEKLEQEEESLLTEKDDLKAEQDELIQRQQNLESYQYTNIWPEVVTPADYEAKKDKIQAKRDYYNDEIYKAKNRIGKYADEDIFDDDMIEARVNRFERQLKQLDEFEAQGKTYVQLSKRLVEIDTRLGTIDDDIKEVREKLMKIRGIDVDKMQSEIDDLTAEIAKLTAKPGTKKVSFDSKVGDFKNGEIDKAAANALADVYPDFKIDHSLWDEVTVEDFATIFPKEVSEKFKKEFEKLITSDSDEVLMHYIGKQASWKTKMEDFDVDDIEAIIKKISPQHYSPGFWASDSVEDFMEMFFDFEDQFDQFRIEIDKLIDANNKIDKQVKKLTKELDKRNDELDKIKKRYGLVTKKANAFDDDAYSNLRKANAKNFTNKRDADKYLRQISDGYWDTYSDLEKYAQWEYTHNSHPINKSLSGYHDTWDRSGFVGLGNADWNHENSWRSFDTADFRNRFGVNGHVQYDRTIKDLTKALDRTEIQDDIWLVRGTDKGGLAGLLEGDLLSYDQAKLLLNSSESQIKKALEGQIFTNHAFTSTGVASGTGFGGEVKYRIYAPKGTKGAYVEPASYYGDTINMTERIYKVGDSYNSVSTEAEIILQRGTSFRITEVKKDNWGDIEITMEIVEQPDYFNTGWEQTFDKGATSFKHQ